MNESAEDPGRVSINNPADIGVILSYFLIVIGVGVWVRLFHLLIFFLIFLYINLFKLNKQQNVSFPSSVHVQD